MKTKLTWLTFLFLILTVSVKAIDKKITTSDSHLHSIEARKDL